MAKIAQQYTLEQIANALKIAKEALRATNASVDTVSVLIVAANKKRKSLVLTNSGTKIAYLGIDEAAVDLKGIYLAANGGTWTMDNFTYSNKAIYGISSGGVTNISIQEFI